MLPGVFGPGPVFPVTRGRSVSEVARMGALPHADEDRLAVLVGPAVRLVPFEALLVAQDPESPGCEPEKLVPREVMLDRGRGLAHGGIAPAPRADGRAGILGCVDL